MLMPSPQRFQVRASDANDIEWAAQLAKRVYDDQDAIPAEVLLAWFNVNPTGFSTMWCDGERVGNFHILPLKLKAMALFVEGQILERNFPADSLYAAEESQSIRDLYWESAVLDPSLRGELRGKMLVTLTADFSNVFGRVCDLRQIDNMYAIAASSRGAEHLLLLGMSPLGNPELRMDKHQLYHGTLRSFREAIAILLASK